MFILNDDMVAEFKWYRILIDQGTHFKQSNIEVHAVTYPLDFLLC